MIFPDVLDQFRFVQAPRVAVQKENLVLGRCERFQKEHPEVRHEVVGNAVVGVIKQDVHERVASPGMELDSGAGAPAVHMNGEESNADRPGSIHASTALVPEP